MGRSGEADSLSLRIELGSGMRYQRALEALVLVLALLTADVRPVWGVLGALAAQVVSPRLALVAVLVATLRPAPERPHVSHIYNDFQGIRGSAAVAAGMLSVGLALIGHGHAWGWVLVACPTASCLLAPTVGFCAGCTCYVAGRELVMRVTQRDPRVDGASDVILESDPSHPR